MTSKFTEKRILIAALTVACVTATAVGFAFPCDIVRVYQSKLQTPLFSGFLTLAGFILSVKTNILLRLHKDLFDSPEYKELVKTASLTNPEPVRRFRPLISLGRYLVHAVLGCFLVAVFQVTIGFIQHPWASALSIGTAAGGIVLVLAAWATIKANLNSWFGILSKSDDAECEEARKQKQRDRELTP